MRVETIGDHVLYLADCREVLPTLSTVDAIITDPPFGVGNFVQVTGNLRGRGKSFNQAVDWNNNPPDESVFDLIRQKSRQRIIWGANFFNCFEEKGGAIVWVKKQPMPNF